MTIKKELQRSYYLMALLPILFFISTAITINFFLHDQAPTREEKIRELPVILPIAFTILTILIAIIMTLNLMITRKQIKRITLPLTQLEKSAQNIMDGTLTTPVVYEKNDEFTNIFETFDEMRKQLVHSIEARKQLENNRTTFLNGITHDILTPLTVIKGYVEALQDDIAKTPEKQAHYLAIIQEKTALIEQLVEKMTVINTFQSNHYPFRFKQYEMSLLIDEFTKTLQSDYPSLTFSIQNTIPKKRFINLDYNEFYRVLNNFVENSIKYVKADFIHIFITAQHSNNDYQIIFTDNGEGVDSKQLPYIFEPFYRADAARTNIKDGSGLGLAICQQIIHAHGGMITAQNKQSLEFTITLPTDLENAYENTCY